MHQKRPGNPHIFRDPGYRQEGVGEVLNSGFTAENTFPFQKTLLMFSCMALPLVSLDMNSIHRR